MKLFTRILIKTCCLSTSYVLVIVSIYRNNVRRMVRWVRIPTFREGLKEKEAAGEREKGGLEDRSKGKSRTSCHCPLLPWMVVLWGPLDLGEAAGIQGMGVLY